MLSSNIAVEIYDCFVYKQNKTQTFNKSRSFSALSYRCDTGCTYTFNGKSVYAPPNSVVFVPSNLAYSTKTSKGKMFVVHFNILNYDYNEIEIIDEKASPEIFSLFKNAISEWNNKRLWYKFKTTSIFYDILSHTSDNLNISDNKNELVSKCAEFISTHFQDANLTIRDVAEFAHISESYLRRKFSEEYSISPMKYLIEQRIAYAKYLISTEYFSQTEISEKCGFADVKYFRTAFKKHVGKTILRYKKDLMQKL